jgi:hypothetical protein
VTYIDNHPGGKAKIMLAAGSAINSLCRLYQQHLVLTTMKVGVLDLSEIAHGGPIPHWPWSIPRWQRALAKQLKAEGGGCTKMNFQLVTMSSVRCQSSAVPSALNQPSARVNLRLTHRIVAFGPV